MATTNELKDLAKLYRDAKSAYELTVLSYVRLAEPMADKTVFWYMLEDLKSVITTAVDKRNDPVRYGIYEFVRHLYYYPAEMYSFDDVPSFIRTYGKLKSRLAKFLTNILEDLFSDLVDSLPLAGKIVCLRVMSGEPVESVMEDSDSARFVVGKENLVEQSLEQCYSDFLMGVLSDEKHQA